MARVRSCMRSASRQDMKTCNEYKPRLGRTSSMRTAEQDWTTQSIIGHACTPVVRLETGSENPKLDWDPACPPAAWPVHGRQQWPRKMGLGSNYTSPAAKACTQRVSCRT